MDEEAPEEPLSEERVQQFMAELDAGFEEWAKEARLAQERVLAGAARTLIADDEVGVALALIECDIAIINADAANPSTLPPTSMPNHAAKVIIQLLCPPSVLGTVKYGTEAAPLYDGVLRSAFEANLPPRLTLAELVVRAMPAPITSDWREQVRAGLEGQTTNQGTPIGTSPIATHNGLNYRSRTEIALAKELEGRSILFLPNCRASRGKTIREPDFLIFYKGRAGILEVDGPTHTGKAADDHMRDLFFEQSGIRVKHFNWEDVRDNPALVLDTFLDLLTGPSH